MGIVSGNSFSVQFLHLRLGQCLDQPSLHSCCAALTAVLNVVYHPLPRVKEEAAHWADASLVHHGSGSS